MFSKPSFQNPYLFNIIMSKNYYTSNLYPFQDLVLKLIMQVDDIFYLTGGTALGRYYLKHRYSDDLDLFVNRENNFKQLSNKIISQLQHYFSEIEIALLSEYFAQIFIHNEEYSLKIEFVNDVFFHRDIEVFFKMCKQHLKLVKEIQIWNYDGLIGHTSLVMARYNILSLFQRESVDQRSFEDLFRAFNEELAIITFIDALKRIMQLAMAALRNAHNLSERIINSILDLIMGEAIAYFGLNNSPMPQLEGGQRLICSSES